MPGRRCSPLARALQSCRVNLHTISPLVVAISAGATFAFLSALYRWLTRRQRGISQEIRDRAEQNGWQYHKRRWEGNPVTFRIDGHTPSGIPWVLKLSGAGENAQGWTMELTVRYPTLAGETDVAITPRDDGQMHAAMAASVNAQSWLSSLSQTLAGAVHFMGSSQECPSGFDAFDSMYQVLLSRDFTRKPLVDSTLAQQWLNWPPDALHPHALLAWRDPFGFVIEARLSGPPNWITVSYLLDIGNEFMRSLPVGRVPSGQQHLVDRVISKVVQ